MALGHARVWGLLARACARFDARVAVALLAAACDTEVKDVQATTQVTLEVDAEPALRAQVSELRASLWIERAGAWRQRSSARVPLAALRWPVDIPVVASRSEDESAPFEVLLSAHDAAGNLLAQSRVLTMFLAGKRTWVSAPRLATCSGHEAGFVCDGEGCHGAACKLCEAATGACLPVAPVVPSDALGASDAGASDAGTAFDAGSAQGDGSVRDGGEPLSSADAARDGAGETPRDGAAPVDGDVPDAGPPAPNDGGTPPRTCPADNTCKAPFDCVPTALGYTCRGQFADWPMPDAMMGAKVAPSYSSDSITVVDNVTKLQWQIGIPTTYPGCLESSEGGTPGELCTRLEGRNYCDALAHGGYDDWRLPSLIELVSLFDTQRETGNAGIDLGYFGDTEYWAFVSDSTSATGPSYIWGVNFFARATGTYPGYYGKVRCVRAGAEPPFATPAERYAVDTAADTVTDRATGLIWLRSLMATKVAKADAEARCTGGFRLPTTNELLSLVDPTRADPAIDPNAFPGTPSDFFWVSPRAATESGVNFSTGELDFVDDPMAYVRCVR